jgi:hypothetical protein
MAKADGLEPATSGVTGRRSNGLPAATYRTTNSRTNPDRELLHATVPGPGDCATVYVQWQSVPSGHWFTSATA